MSVVTICSPSLPFLTQPSKESGPHRYQTNWCSCLWPWKPVLQPLGCLLLWKLLFLYFIPCVMLSLTFLLLEQFEWWGVLDWVASVAAQSIWSPTCRKKLLLVMLTLVYCCLQFCAPNNAITTDSSSQHLYPSF